MVMTYGHLVMAIQVLIVWYMVMVHGHGQLDQLTFSFMSRILVVVF